MKKQRKLPQQQLPSRKSPRFSSSSSSPAAAASSTRTRNEPEPRPDDAWALSLPQEGNSLRRSARFASKTPPPQSRTSPTFPPSSSLTLTDGENAVLSERCLRSRTVLMKRVVSERRGRGKAAAEIEMLALTPVSAIAKTQLVEQSVELNKEQFSLEGVSEKRLRSRIVQFRHNVAENAARKRDRNAESAVRSGSIQLKQDVAESAVVKAEPKGGGRNEDRPWKKKKEEGVLCCFVGEPITEEEARGRWQWRYDLKVNAC